MKNPLEFFEKMTLKDLKAWRTLLMFALIADLLGVFWFLEWKKFGVAIMIVVLVLMGIILFYERRKYDQMPKKKKRPEETPRAEKRKKKKRGDEDYEEEDDEEEQGGLLGIGGDMGLPNSDEYNRRLEKSLGM